MVESVYWHNKTWQFIRWPCDTFVPRAHCLPCLFSKSQGSSRRGTFLLVWISDPASKYLSLSQMRRNKSFGGTCFNCPQHTSADLFCLCLSLSRPYLLLHGFAVQEGDQVHGDVTYDTAPETGLAHAQADGVQGFWMHGALRNSEAHSFQLTGAMELISAGHHGHFTPGLQQQVYCQTGDAVWGGVRLQHTAWTRGEKRKRAATIQTAKES